MTDEQNVNPKQDKTNPDAQDLKSILEKKVDTINQSIKEKSTNGDEPQDQTPIKTNKKVSAFEQQFYF